MKLAQNYNEAHMIQVMEEAKDACEPELKEIIEKNRNLNAKYHIFLKNNRH